MFKTFQDIPETCEFDKNLQSYFDIMTYFESVAMLLHLVGWLKEVTDIIFTPQ